MPIRASRLFLPLAIALITLAGAPSTADALCGEAPSIPDGIARADIAFVGTVANLSRGNSYATFAVEDVWRGDDLPAVVTIHPWREGFTEDEHVWRLGGHYLVVVHDDAGTLWDNACCVTRPWTDGLTALRPADAHPPVDRTPTSGPPGDPPYAFVFLLIVAGGAAAGFLLLRRR